MSNDCGMNDIRHIGQTSILLEAKTGARTSLFFERGVSISKQQGSVALKYGDACQVLRKSVDAFKTYRETDRQMRNAQVKTENSLRLFNKSIINK